MSYWQDKTVLVTGGTGFLGTHVSNELRGREPADLRSVGSDECDLTDQDEARRLFEETRPDVVVHLAGLVGGIAANEKRPAEFFYQNLTMGAFTLHLAWEYGAEKAVAAAAGCGYPEDAPMPLREETFWAGFPQEESAPYSLAKRMLHVQAEAYERQYGFPTVVTVPGNLYGPYDNFDLESAHVIPALVRKFVEAAEEGADTVTVWGTGKPTRDFVYAGDVAKFILRAAEVYEGSTLVNISSGVESSIREVAETLKEITGFEGRIVWDTTRPDGQERRLFDMTKAREEMGYEPETTLREGLEKTVRWFRENRDSART